MANVYSFDEKAIAAAIETARNHYDSAKLLAQGQQLDPFDDGHMRLAAGACISVTVENGKICLNLPLGIGNYCLPIPSFIPNGTAASACISVCTTWGIPTGVRVTVSVAGNVVVEKTFLKC